MSPHHLATKSTKIQILLMFSVSWSYSLATSVFIIKFNLTMEPILAFFKADLILLFQGWWSLALAVGK